MKNEHQLLLKVMKNFEGMNKLDVFDMLHKIEVLLFYTSSPITRYHIKKVIEVDMENKKDIDPFHFTILPNGNFCELVGSNKWLHIYKEQKWGIYSWPIFDTYYFKTKYAPLELLKFTKKNLLENIENTPEYAKVIDFLKREKLMKRNAATERFVILDI